MSDHLRGSRYLATVHGGTRNASYSSVAAAFRDSILKHRAENGNPAVYRPKEEQERLLLTMYKRFEEKGGVWSAASAKVSLLFA